MEGSDVRWLFDPMMGKVVAAVIGIILIVVLVRFAQGSLSRYIKDSNTRYRTRKFVSFAGYLIGFLIIVVIFSDKLGGFTVALGVAGAGIAFALQEIIASVAGWFAISFAKFYNTGDRVQLGGIKGDVIDIGILRTTVMEVGDWVKGDQYNGRVVRIANSFVFKEPVFNYSGDFPFLWDEISIPVKHGSDHQLAREILQRVAHEIVGDYAGYAQTAWNELVKKYLIEDAQVEPMIALVVTDGWLEFSVRYVVDYKKRRLTKDRLYTRILDEFAQTQGRVAITAATLEVTAVSPLDTQLKSRDANAAETLKRS